jgi:hypothetical protein
VSADTFCPTPASPRLYPLQLPCASGRGGGATKHLGRRSAAFRLVSAPRSGAAALERHPPRSHRRSARPCVVVVCDFERVSRNATQEFREVARAQMGMHTANTMHRAQSAEHTKYRQQPEDITHSCSCSVPSSASSTTSLPPSGLRRTHALNLAERRGTCFFAFVFDGHTQPGGAPKNKKKAWLTGTAQAAAAVVPSHPGHCSHQRKQP